MTRSSLRNFCLLLCRKMVTDGTHCVILRPPVLRSDEAISVLHVGANTYARSFPSGLPSTIPQSSTVSRSVMKGRNFGDSSLVGRKVPGGGGSDYRRDGVSAGFSTSTPSSSPLAGATLRTGVAFPPPPAFWPFPIRPSRGSCRVPTCIGRCAVSAPADVSRTHE